MFTPSDTFPYIGLRPFSEEDSLYFKGRDEQILQITALLEANKFLMVTGASGDGKSSLVYAGLVPNARAGFFKARYTNWVVADFRPERTPLHNLSKTISRNLRIGNEDSAEVELRRGFSSLVELYTTSPLYVDEQGGAWRNASADKRDNLLREAANLLIVADQFEEFFTNPENYYRNAPSADSQLVINLLLETARLATNKNLPIYIVCTMRSDYIGQCAAFRGLPEFIGFSQFFVPRLKRKEMIQVVKEPAVLHGDKITNRLAERVVYDLGEGIDQLPVLEHAMNEVWIQAKHGNEELDLLHYAMAGGMPPQELPVEYRKPFDDWFSKLSSKLQEAYKHPGLSQIIDTHANKLYLSAADHYNDRHDKKITSSDAQVIIKIAFTCFTKMDEGRAVRNRMSLQEITDILARPELSWEVVGGVLDIFRETGNTFLRPYITDEVESRQLKPESVLDITHESLIRNWELLTSWAKEEFDHLTVYEDFKKQLDRWVESGKANGFLLPIGPLTFFENWHSKLNPNKYWVNRYLDPGLDHAARMKEAQQIIKRTREFLTLSARKVRVTRLVVKYGATRIAAVIGSILIIGLCGFYYRDAQQKENDNVIKTILAEGSQFLSDQRYDVDRRASFLILSEVNAPGSFRRLMDKIPSDKSFDLILEVYNQFAIKGGNPSLRKYCIQYGDSLIRTTSLRSADPGSLMDHLKAWNILATASSHYLYYYSDSDIETILQRSAGQIKEILPFALSQGFGLAQINMTLVAGGIENSLNFGAIDKEATRTLLALISPFESKGSKDRFNLYFPADKQILYSGLSNASAQGASTVGSTFKHNAGYQEVAYLYASLGKVREVKSCVDSLLKYHPNYGAFRINVLNIAAYLFKNGFRKETEELMAYYAERKKVSVKESYELMLNSCGYLDRHLFWKLVGANHNANLELLDMATVNGLFDQYFSALQKEYKTPDALNFNLALYFKHRGIILSKMAADHGGRYQFNPDSLFKMSVVHYLRVSPAYLNQTEDAYVEDFNFQVQVKQKLRRKDLFLYPDHFQKVLNSRDRPSRYFSDRFFLYLVRKQLLSQLYADKDDLSQINSWIFEYDRFNPPWFPSRLAKNYTPLNKLTLPKIDSIMTDHPRALGLNLNRLRLMLMEQYREQHMEKEMELIYQKLEPARFGPENFKEGSPRELDMFSYRVGQLTEYLAIKGRKNEAFQIMKCYPKPSNLIKAYAIAPLELLVNPLGPKEDAFQYLDSAITEVDRLKDFEFFGDDPRIAVVLSLSLAGGKDMDDLARKFVSKISLGQQNGVLQAWIMGTAMSGNYYQAFSSIPEILLSERLHYFNLILSAAAMKKENNREWMVHVTAFQKQYMWVNMSFEADLF